MSILALDLGWKWIGRVFAPVEELPLAGIRSDRLRMSPADPWPVLERIMADVRANDPSRVIIEHAPFFAPAGKSAAALARLAQMHEPSSTMAEILAKALVDAGYSRLSLATPFPSPLPPRTVITIPRMTWAHRVRPHTQGGITDEMAIEAMRPHITAESWAQMETQDEIDAGGAALWWLLPAQKRARKRGAKSSTPPRPAMTPEQRVATEREQGKLRMRRKHGYLTIDERWARGCQCGSRRHRVGCPLVAGRLVTAIAHGSWLR